MTAESDKGLVETLEAVVEEILPPRCSAELIKEEIWMDLSHIYYKYEGNRQKRAFREIMSEISKEINQGNWNHVYQKLYRLEAETNHL